MTENTNLLGAIPSGEDDEPRLLARRVAKKLLKQQEGVRKIPHEQWSPETWREILTTLLESHIKLMNELDVAHCAGREMFVELKRKDGEVIRRIGGRADIKAREYVRDFVAEEHAGYESHLQLHRDIMRKDGLHQDFIKETVLKWVRGAWKEQGRDVHPGRPKEKGPD